MANLHENKIQADNSASYWLKIKNDPVFWIAIVVGFLLIVVWIIGVGLLNLPVRPNQLILVTGLGILLATFGGRAFIEHQYIVMGGCAAIAFVFAWILWDQTTRDYVILQIDGISDTYRLSVHGHREFYSAYLGQNRAEFIAMSDHLKTRAVEITVSPPEGPDSVFKCIDKSNLTRAIGQLEPVYWTIQLDRGSLIDDKTREIAKLGHCKDSSKTRGTNWLLNFISTALASSRPKIERHIEKLDSSSAFERRNSREALVGYGVEGVAPMMEELTKEAVNPRVQAGILVALIDIVRDAQSQNKLPNISASIYPEALPRIVELASHKDTTLRNYAVELLLLIANADIGDLAAAAFASADTDAKKVGLLSVIRRSSANLSDAQRTLIAVELSGVSDDQQWEPGTNSEIDAVISVVAGGEPKYWVIVGSYLDRNNADRHADEINKEAAHLAAFVGKKSPGNEFYPVIVGGYVNRQKADQLLAEALGLDSVTEAYLGVYAERR